MASMKRWMWVPILGLATGACGSVNEKKPDATGSGAGAPCVLDQAKLDGCKL